MESHSPEPIPLTAKRAVSVPQIVIGAVIIISQLIRQPGFGFWVGGGNDHSVLAPASGEVLGYDLFAAFMYALGVFLIWRGLSRKKI
jgi:hypothetical protein